MTRILYVLERYPELSQTFVAEEISGLQVLGCEIEVAALQRGRGGTSPAAARVACEASGPERIGAALAMSLRSPGAVGDQLLRESAWPPPGGSHRVRGLLRLAPLIPLAKRADHIHAHFATEAADVARLLAAASGTPWSFTAHGADSYSDPTALATNLASASFARACSRHVAEQLLSAAREGTPRIVEIPVAVAVDRFSECGGPVDPGPIVSVGRLVEKKGFDDLIAAVSAASASLDGRELLIVGEGPLRARLEEMISATRAPVRLLGEVDNLRLPSLLAGASLFALTPRTAGDGDRDGRPAALVEAMAAGLPILSTSQPGIPDLVGSDCGRLAPPGDRDALAAALVELLGLSEAERRTMGEAGRREVVHSYSRERVAARLLEEIEAATPGSAG